MTDTLGQMDSSFGISEFFAAHVVLILGMVIYHFLRSSKH